jgi:hypothetical protein
MTQPSLSSISLQNPEAIRRITPEFLDSIKGSTISEENHKTVKQYFSELQQNLDNPGAVIHKYCHDKMAKILQSYHDSMKSYEQLLAKHKPLKQAIGKLANIHKAERNKNPS